MPLESGPVKNVVLKLPEPHMTLNFSAKIIINAKEKTGAIHDSVLIDNAFYPENPVKTE